MENTPLNRAHQFRRKAEILTKQGKYSEAALCHLEAVKNLQELVEQVSSDSPVFRSLEEQCQFHQRHAEIAQALRKIAERQQAIKAKKLELKAAINPVVRKPPMASEIGRAVSFPIDKPRLSLDDFDSLLQILAEPKRTSELKEVQNTKQFVEFTIRPKNDAEVIEELQTVNENLRTLVDKLLNELKIVQEEKQALEKKLLAYESSDQKLKQQSQKASSNFMMELEESPTLDMLPELEPLETPDFNFS